MGLSVRYILLMLKVRRIALCADHLRNEYISRKKYNGVILLTVLSITALYLGVLGFIVLVLFAPLYVPDTHAKTTSHFRKPVQTCESDNIGQSESAREDVTSLSLLQLFKPVHNSDCRSSHCNSIRLLSYCHNNPARLCYVL